MLNRKHWLFLPAEQELQGWCRLVTTLGTEAVQAAEQRTTREQLSEESRDHLFELVLKELENEDRQV